MHKGLLIVLLITLALATGCNPSSLAVLTPTVSSLSPPQSSVSRQMMDSGSFVYPEPKPNQADSSYPPPRDGNSIQNAYPTPIQPTMQVIEPTEQIDWQFVEVPGRSFSLHLPIDWVRDPSTGAYSGKDGFFRMKYLPEMGFVSRVYQVCEWLANTTQKEWKAQSLDIWRISGCELVRRSGKVINQFQVVINDPNASPNQRYLLLEMDPKHIESILSSLRVSSSSTDNNAMQSTNEPMRPEDEAFWAKSGVLPEDMAIIETPLVKATPDGDVDNVVAVAKKNYDNIYNGNTAKIVWRSEDASAKEDSLNAILNDFGYHLEFTGKDSNGRSNYILYQGKEQLLDKIEYFGQVTTSASEKDFAVVFKEINGSDWLLQKDGLQPWDRDPFQWILADPILYGDELIYPIWNPQAGQVQIIKNGEPIYSFTTVLGANNPVTLFTKWEGHWLLGTRGFLIQDGVLLNDKLGYEEIFDWSLLDGKPFYFFPQRSAGWDFI